MKFVVNGIMSSFNNSFIKIQLKITDAMFTSIMQFKEV